MTDALSAAPTAPQTDALGEDTSLPNAQTNTIPVDDAPEVSPDEKRSNDVKKAIDDALGDDAEKPKPKVAAKAKADEVKTEAKPEKAETAPPEATKPAPRPTAYREPPAGFDDAAKGEWEAVPESVRGAVHRRAQEMEHGIQKYRDAAQEYEPVRKFADMAKQSGTTLDQALGRYVGMEQRLRQDPMGGLEEVVANLGLRRADGNPVTLRDVAASIMGQTPDQNASRQDGIIQHQNRQIQEMSAKIARFDEFVSNAESHQRNMQGESIWSEFQRQNPDAARLEPQIAAFLTKYPANDSVQPHEWLADAYAAVSSRNPSVAHTDATPLVQTQTPASPNPAGQKSISGAPGGNDAKTVSRNLNRSAAVEKAMRQAGL